MILSGSPLDYLIAFWAGVLVSFTPCVYPLLPVTIGYIGANSAGSKRKGFLLSFTYASGIALTYSALGLFAALTGTLFGRFSFGPYGYFLVAAVVFFCGLSMLDLFQLPALSNLRLPRLRRGDYPSTFLLGLASGLIASPCLTPVLGAILAYIAGKRNIVYGATLLLIFAYGMGVVLILAGTFSGILANLPKLGRGAAYIKRFCALLLLAAAVYFAWEGLKRAPVFKLAQAAETPLRRQSQFAYDFTLQDLKGESFSLSSFRDKQPVIIFFWTASCPYCRDELKRLERLSPQLVKEGWELAAINVGEPRARVENFLRRFPLSFRVLLDKEADVAFAYGIFGVPTYVIIDQSGQVSFQDNYFPTELINTRY